ncbi:probable adenylyl-cyclase-associated protein CAP [Pseudozyma flocculosa]|uniref:Adenylyl cyclase-associated protein n=1 Tax=Pseudozyma flocculosa TaxID=84751 RepID=A0A5C3ESD8_9BASI|nr:probable adenylyl-cyclase-associated protein CAP [Pseudozyma flocculosa]
MATSGIGNLGTLIKRLEAATSRLEDITVAQSQSYSQSGQPGAAALAGAAAGAAPPPPPPPPPPAPVEEVKEDPTSVKAWDASVAGALAEYQELSGRIGNPVAEQANIVVKTFAEQRNLILLAASCTKPAGGLQSPAFAKLLQPLQAALMEVIEVRDKNRGEKRYFNHLSTVSEGIPAVGWVAIEPKPGPYVAEMKDSAQFYANRVIKDYKDTDKTQVEWCRSFIKLLEALRTYIMQNQTTGLVWNPQGSDPETFKAGAGSAAAPSAGGPPPPPPPPPVADLSAGSSAQAAPAAGGMDAVFGQLNQGESVTKGLRKVDPSQMTHKNPELRASSTVAAPTKAAPPRPAAKPASLKAKKPPRTELEGNRWNIEYHEDNSNIILDQTELNQTVNIFNCKNCTIQIRGKINAVQMANCQKTSILIDTLVSSLEITGSPSFAAQITGSTPTVLLDSNDSGQLYLSKTSLDTEIIAAKCSAINVNVPLEGGEEGEFEEYALPEQLKFTIDKSAGKKDKIRSEIVVHTA